jgi:hypothetical protein
VTDQLYLVPRCACIPQTYWQPASMCGDCLGENVETEARDAWQDEEADREVHTECDKHGEWFRLNESTGRMIDRIRALRD